MEVLPSLSLDAVEMATEFRRTGAWENYPFPTCHTATNNEFFKPDVVAALLVTSGNFTKMADLLGKTRTRTRDYVRRTPDLMELYNDIREAIVDHVEDDLLRRVTSPTLYPEKAQEQRFVLTTLGKDRGYSQRQENTGKDGVPLPAVIERHVIDVTPRAE